MRARKRTGRILEMFTITERGNAVRYALRDDMVILRSTNGLPYRVYAPASRRLWESWRARKLA